jgi:hypothetical protein
MAWEGALRLDEGDTRVSAGLMLAVAAALPLAGHHAGVPCPLRTLTGIPCPLCGMTTSVVATVHGHVAEAVSANPAGPLAVAVALVALSGRGRTLRIPGVLVVALLTAMWLWELHRFGLI